MKRRLVVLSEIVSPYRIPVFNALVKEEEIDLHVIFLAETDPTQRHWLVYKDEIRFSYEVLPHWRRRIAGRNVLLNRGITAALQRAAPEVILCGGYNYLASWQALRWARRRGMPFLLWAESTIKERRSHSLLVESLKKSFMRRCSAFVVPGKSSSQYVKLCGAAEDSIFTASNAVDTGLFAEQSAVARANAEAQRDRLGLPARYFLFVGRLVPGKGIFDLLKAYAMLAPEMRTNVGLVFVGEGNARRELERVAESGDVKIRMAGFVQRDELAHYYGLADVFVFPTHSDPWGLVVNEAMACGLPVICSEAAGCADDLVTDGWNGYLAPPGDVARLSQSMERLAQNHEERRLMGQHSCERIAGYSPEACAAGIARAALSPEALRNV